MTSANKFYRVLGWMGWMGLVLCVGPMRGAEANTGVTVRNVLSYAFQPVNCVGNLLHDVATDIVQTVWCIIGNVNRNPVTLNPIITTNDSHI